MCETRDVGIKWPQWHTLMFEGPETVYMIVDAQTMFLRQARMVYWRKWAAKHECDELKEGVWLDPMRAVLRRRIDEELTDKHRNVMRNFVVEGV